jgi:hypothetical protein
LEIRKYAPKRNPIRNIEALEALDPYAAEARRAAARATAAQAVSKDALIAKKRATRMAKKAFAAQGKVYYKQVSKQGDVCAEGFNM